jgi:ceramide glucosyltransferase
MFVHLLLYAAIAGLVCCTGFLVLVVYSVVRFRFRPRFQPRGFTPPVTLLKPLCGLEPGLLENLESFFRQDYPEFEIIFGARTGDDPAIRLVEQLTAKYPKVPVKVVYSGEPDRPNAKVCSLERMVRQAATDFYIISDSDVHVRPQYIREVVAPLADAQVGLVSCLYRGVPTGGLWSRLEALGMSVEMTSGVMVSNVVEEMNFALGPTMAAPREAVEKIGGVAPLADYCADDYLLGNWIAEQGYKVVIPDEVIDHIVLNRSFMASVRHQVRWMKSTRFSRPKGHLGTALTFAMPFGVLGLAAGVAMGNAALGLDLFLWAFANRVILSVATGWGVVRDPNAVKYSWLYPLRDLMGFFFWVASYWGTEVVWRNERYKLSYGGKMTRVAGPDDKAESRPVAVDHLA